MDGKRWRRAATMAAVSSTDRVVWVTKASLSGLAGVKLGGRPRRPCLHQVTARPRAKAGPWCRSLRGGRDGRSARSAGRRRGGARPRHMDPWKPAGRWRRDEITFRVPRLGRDRLGHAVGGEDHRPVGGAVVQFLDEHRAHGPQSLDHMAVMQRSRGAHRPARHTSRSTARQSGSPDRRPRRTRADWRAGFLGGTEGRHEQGYRSSPAR